jgi:hypothetical protein
MIGAGDEAVRRIGGPTSRRTRGPRPMGSVLADKKSNLNRFWFIGAGDEGRTRDN